MVDQIGGTPFSFFLGGSKKRNRFRTSKRQPKKHNTKKPSRKKKRRLQTKKKRDQTKKASCKTCKCKCKFTGKELSPKGLGFCEKCQPLNVIIRGKDNNLWKIEKKGKTKKWIKIN